MSLLRAAAAKSNSISRQLQALGRGAFQVSRQRVEASMVNVEILGFIGPEFAQAVRQASAISGIYAVSARLNEDFVAVEPAAFWPAREASGIRGLRS